MCRSGIRVSIVSITSLGVLVHRGLLSFCTAHSSEVLLTVRVTGSTGSAASLPSSLAYTSYMRSTRISEKYNVSLYLGFRV